VSDNLDTQPTWPLLLKIEKGGWNLICFPLKLLGQLDSSFAKIIRWWSIPFQNFVWHSCPRTKMDAVTKFNDSCTL